MQRARFALLAAAVSAALAAPAALAAGEHAAQAPGGADLQIVLSADAAAAAGNDLAYSIVVRDGGPYGAQATVTDKLPAAVALVSVRTSMGSCSGGATVSCSLGMLSPGGPRPNVTIVVHPLAPGTLTNSATVSSDRSDPNDFNNHSTVTTRVLPVVPPFPPVGISRAAVRLSRGGVARVVASCDRSTFESCTGHMSLFAYARPPGGSKQYFHFGDADFTLAPGQVSAVAMGVPRPALKLIHALGHLRVNATIDAQDGDGTLASSSSALTLKGHTQPRPPKRPGHR